MNTIQNLPTTDFPQTVSFAVGRLKQRLRLDYEQAYPDLRDIIHLVLDEEETRARELSLFPHLLLPDLVEARMATLNLEPVEAKHHHTFDRDAFAEFRAHQPAFAFCGS